MHAVHRRPACIPVSRQNQVLERSLLHTDTQAAQTMIVIA